jgi:signal transduction histidine kinase
MTVVVFVLVFTANRVMVNSLRTSLNESLRNHASLVSAEIGDSENTGQSYADAVKTLIEEEIFAPPLLTRVADSNGNVLATFGTVPDSVVPKLDKLWQSLDDGNGQFETIKTSRGHSIRIYAILVRDPSDQAPIALVEVGDSLDQIDEAETRLLIYTIAEAICGSIVIVLIGTVILRRGLRPLDRILARVAEVEASNLEAGLPEEPRPPELQRLADKLNGMWLRLAQAMKKREGFVASVSHDLRTPLSALQGQIDVLLAQPSPDSNTKESLKRMQKEVRRLIRMSNNLLLNAQLESQPTFTRWEVNLRELLEETVGELAGLAQGLDLALLASEDVLVSGDHDLLKQMVLNVAHNALKYTPKGGQVELALSQEDGWAVVQVSDSGRGISQEHLPHVMEPFYRGNASGRSTEAEAGAGLGLAIVKQIVELHDGQVEIHSQEGIGTRVKIRLPIMRASDQQER